MSQADAKNTALPEKSEQVTNPKSAKSVDYTVETDCHVHRGKPCQKGDVIKLTAGQAEKMKKRAEKAQAELAKQKH